MKVLSRVLLLSMLFLTILSATQAASPKDIILNNCNLNASSVACGDTLVASCDATVDFGEETIIEVQFTIGGEDYNAILTSGNNTDGTWEASVPIDYTEEGLDVGIDYILARSSGGRTCAGSEDTSESGCFIDITSPNSATNSCDCTYTTTSGSVTVNNTVIYTVTPSQGCAPTEEVSTYEDFADYCDPQWESTYEICSADRDSTTPFLGTTTKSYSSDNPACCSQTRDNAGNVDFNHNTGSDCTAPLDDGINKTCQLDSWLKYGDDLGGTGQEEHFNQGFNEDSYTSIIKSVESSFQPLAGDLDDDGQMEIYIFSNSSNIVYRFDYAVTSNSLTVTDSYSLGGDITGQPAVFGIDDTGGTAQNNNGNPYVVSSSGPYLVIPVKTGGGSKIVTLSADLTLQDDQTYAGVDLSGVACKGDYCFFADSGGDGHKYDPVNATDETKHIFVGRSGGSWINLTNFRIYSSGVPTFETYLTSSTAVFWPMYKDTTGSLNYTTGYYLATDYSDFGYLKAYDLRPSEAVTLGSETQSSYNLRGQLVISEIDSNRRAYATAEEITTSGGVNYLTMNYYGFSVNDVGLGAEVVSKTPKRVWKGEKSSNDEGISNVAIADDLPSVKISHLTQDIGTSSFNDPVLTNLIGSTTDLTTDFNDSALDGFSPEDFKPDDVALTSNGQTLVVADWDETGIDESLIAFYSMSTGSKLDEHRDTGGSTGIGDMYLYDEGDYIFYGDAYTQSSSTMRCLNISTFTSVFDCGSLGGSGVPAAVVGVLSERDELITTGFSAQVQGSNIYDVSGLNLTGNLTPDLDNNGRDDKLVGYNSDSDILLTQQGIYINYSSEVSTDSGGTYNALPSRIASTGAFNFQWQEPRYIDSNGFKVTINSLTTGSTSTSSGNCNEFTALFYNSDSYIVGISTNTTSANGPQLAYCDFSDESDPEVTTIGTSVPYRALVANNSGNYIWSLPEFRVRSDNFLYDGTGDYTVVMLGHYLTDNSSLYAANYDLDETRAEPISTAQLTQYFSYDTNNNIQRRVVANYSKKSYVTSADWNGDGSQDLLSPNGIALMSDYSFNDFTMSTGSADQWIIPLDANNDFGLDMMRVSPGGSSINLRVSELQVEAVTEGALDFKKLRCNAMTNSAEATIQVAASVSSPDDMILGIDPGDGTSMYYPNRVGDGEYSYTYQKPGTYEIYVQVTDGGTGEQVSDTCEVEVDFDDEEDKCTLGTDGEFEYSDQVSNHGWLGTAGTFSPNAGQLVLQSGTDQVSHQLTECDSTGFTAVARIEAKRTASFNIFSQSDSSNIFGMIFDYDRGVITTMDGDVTSGSYPDTSKEYVDAKITIDRSTGTGRFFIDDTLIYSKENVLTDIGGVTIAGVADFYFVRTSVSGSRRVSVPEGSLEGLAGASTHLRSCDNEAIQNEASLANRTKFNNVLKYCDSTDSGFCDYRELQLITNKFPSCTKEAYNYCTKRTYPVENGLNQDDTTLQGGTTCSTVLGLSGLYDGIVAPTVGSIWTMLTSNLLVTGIIVFIIIVLIPIAVKNR